MIPLSCRHALRPNGFAGQSAIEGWTYRTTGALPIADTHTCMYKTLPHGRLFTCVLSSTSRKAHRQRRKELHYCALQRQDDHIAGLHSGQLCQAVEVFLVHMKLRCTRGAHVFQPAGSHSLHASSTNLVPDTLMMPAGRPGCAGPACMFQKELNASCHLVSCAAGALLFHPEWQRRHGWMTHWFAGTG